MNGKGLGIYINDKLIGVTNPTEWPLPTTEPTSILSPTLSNEITFEGLYVPDLRPPDEMEIQYTARRKGKVYFKVLNHPYITSGYSDDEETYKLFKGVKRGLKLQGKVTMQE